MLLGAGAESGQGVGCGVGGLPGALRGRGGSLSGRTSLTPAPCSLTPPQIIFEGVRGSGYLGDIAIDDVTLKKGECPRKQMDPNKGEGCRGVWICGGPMGRHLCRGRRVLSLNEGWEWLGDRCASVTRGHLGSGLAPAVGPMQDHQTARPRPPAGVPSCFHAPVPLVPVSGRISVWVQSFPWRTAHVY